MLPTRVGHRELRLDGVRDVALGQFHSACVTCAGETFSWGWDVDGGLGHGNLRSLVLQPKRLRPVAGLGAVQVACGATHTVVLTTLDQPCNGNLTELKKLQEKIKQDNVSTRGHQRSILTVQKKQHRLVRQPLKTNAPKPKKKKRRRRRRQAVNHERACRKAVSKFVRLVLQVAVARCLASAQPQGIRQRLFSSKFQRPESAAPARRSLPQGHRGENNERPATARPFKGVGPKRPTTARMASGRRPKTAAKARVLKYAHEPLLHRPRFQYIPTPHVGYRRIPQSSSIS